MVRFVLKPVLQMSKRATMVLQSELEAFLGFGVTGPLRLGRPRTDGSATRAPFPPDYASGDLAASAKPEPAGTEVVVSGEPYPWDLSPVDLFRLQRDARDLINQAIGGRGYQSTTISDKQELIVDVIGGPGTRTLRVGGSVRASFLLKLAILMLTDAGRRVSQCPECGSFFVRVRRQKYCKRKCTDRATWRNYPKEKKERARQKEYDKHGWTLGARKKGGRKK